MKKKIKRIVISLVAIIFLTACGNNKTTDSSTTKDNQPSDKLTIVTTFYPVYDFTKNIVGDTADVKLLIPAGTEPHDYEPSAKSIAEIQDADAFIYHNENMETWVEETAKGWQEDQPIVIKATEGMTLMAGEEDHEHDESHDHSHAYDPHTWLAPSLAKEEVEGIFNQLSEKFPDKKETFEENTTAYLEKLTELDEEYATSFREAKQKSFVTQHAAFGYLAKEYGLQQVAISGLSSEEEPSPSRLAELKDYVAENEIHYIYFEENASDKIAKTLAEEANVELEVLNPLESLTSEQIKAGEDYISVMKDNLKALEKTTTVSGKEIKDEH